MKDRIKELRKDLNLTMEEFGNKAGIQKSAVSRIESGSSTPGEQTIILICERFGINRRWLETGEGDRLRVPESTSLIPRLQKILQDHPIAAQTLDTALKVMKPEDVDRLIDSIEETIKILKNARG